MIYRNGKCYNNNGTEMSLSQINQMAKASFEYIKQLSCPMSIKFNCNVKHIRKK